MTFSNKTVLLFELDLFGFMYYVFAETLYNFISC